MPFHPEYLGVEQPAAGQLIRELRQILKLTKPVEPETLVREITNLLKLNQL